MKEACGFSRAAGFGHIPRINNDLFKVRAGIDADEMISHAACLADSISALAGNAVSNEGMDVATAHLVEFAADAIHAMMNSVDGAYQRKAVQP